jgi:hypothetical protein
MALPLRRCAPFLLLVLAFVSGSASQLRAQDAPASADWISLQSAAAWRGYRSATLPEGWRFDATTGILTRERLAGDIITVQQFEDFELELEWRVGRRGNSGIFYRATEGTRRIYENAPEMQILDNTGHADGRNSLTSAGANYGLHAPSRDVTRPVGEWNAVRLVVRGAQVEHWLNGERVVAYELWTDDWKAKVKGSKFNEWPAYGWATRGYIGLQDHGDVVSFRNIRVRELAP